MRIVGIVAVLGMITTQALAQSTPRQDALVESYFAIWDRDANVTLANVRRLYASRLIYYGRAMTPESLFRDKLDFTRRWPERRYAVAPGSAARRCDAGENRCILTVTLNWRTGGPYGMRAGSSRVTLVLAREDGALKIVREGAVTLRRRSAVESGSRPAFLQLERCGSLDLLAAAPLEGAAPR